MWSFVAYSTIVLLFKIKLNASGKKSDNNLTYTEVPGHNSDMNFNYQNFQVGIL